MSRSRRRVAAVLLAGLTTLGLVTAAPAQAAAPTLTSFTPQSGTIYTPVTLVGSNFTAPATVRFNGVVAPATVVASATRITTKVPLTASTGKISVTTAGGTVTSTQTFTVTPGVTLSRTVGPPTSSVTVYFAGFAAYEAVDVYLDTTDVALASVDGGGAGRIAVTVPASATAGTHWITTVGRHSGYSAQTSYAVHADWRQYGYVPDHRSSNAYENTLNTSNVGTVEEDWRIDPPGPGPGGSPAIVGGVVYEGFGDAQLHAIDETTGADKWTYSAGSSVSSSAAVVGGMVYFGTRDGDVVALNAASGALKWSYATGGPVVSSPTVDAGVVYVGSDDGEVYALNAANGGELWSYNTGSPVTSSPAVSGNLVFVGSTSGIFYALEYGVPYWSTDLGSPVSASPTVVANRVYVGTTGGVMYSLDGGHGSVQWTYTTGGEIESGAAVAAGVVYFESVDDKVYSLLTATGSVRWIASSPTAMTGAPTISNGVVYATSEFRTYALAAASGLPLWTVPEGADEGYVVVSDGTLTFTETGDYALVHYTLTGGQPAPAARPSAPTLRPNRSLRAAG